jgi:transposase
MTTSTLILPASGEQDLASWAAIAFVASNSSPGTRQAYATQLRLWFEWCERHHVEPLAGVRRPHVELYARDLEAHGLAAATVALKLVVLTGFYRYCVEEQYDGTRYVVVFSSARERRDIARRLQLLAKIETKLLALEARVARGELVEATKIAAAAATILARSPVKRLFDVTDVGEGRFVYDYDHDALAYDEALAGHYVLATSLAPQVADAEQVITSYRSLQAVERRFRVLKSSLGLRPIRHFTENRVRGHIAICVLAAVAEQLIGNRLRDADLRDPDLDHQHLSADRAFQELDRIRQVTFTAGAQTITAITRRTQLQHQILAALRVDTRAWTQPAITS